MTCPECSAEVDPTATACAACGAPSPAPHASMAAPPGSAGPQGGGAPGPQWSPPPAPHPSGLSGEVRAWGIGAHLGGLLAGSLTAVTLGFLGPLLVWLVKRDHPFVDHHAKEALNFQLTVLVALVASVVLALPALIVGVLTLGIGLLALLALVAVAAVAWVALPIVGAVKAANGEGYRYPLTIRFVR